MEAVAASPGAGDLSGVRFSALTPVLRLTGRNATKADVLVYEVGGRRIALKTYAARPAWIRSTLGRWLIGREAAAYRAAAGVDGILNFLGRPQAWALATEWVVARTLPELGRRRVDEWIFDAVGDTVASLHARGIALADLHHRNVVVCEDNRVLLLDLAAAWVLGDHPGPLQRRFFRRLVELDHLAVARMRARWTGGDVQQAVADSGGSIAAWHRRGRRLKRILDRLRGKKRRSGRGGPPERRRETRQTDG